MIPHHCWGLNEVVPSGPAPTAITPQTRRIPMTDHTLAGQLEQAREWAEDHVKGGYPTTIRQRTAAEIIQSLPDTIVDGDKLRELIEKWDALLSDDDHEDMWGMFDGLRALLPAPAPRTLADLLAEGNAPEEYQWMQARLGDEVVVITEVNPSQVAYLRRSGATGVRSSSWFDQIIPLPDEPCLEWPTCVPAEDWMEKANREAFDVHQATVSNSENVVPEQESNPLTTSNSSPRPKDVKPGEVWLVQHDGHDWVGTRGSDAVGHIWALARTDSEDWSHAYDSGVTLLHRLVPEQGDVS